MRTRAVKGFCGCIVFLFLVQVSRTAEVPSVNLALQFLPVQKDVEYESPAVEQEAKCRLKVERSGKSSGWVVIGPAGQILRRYVDTNGDNVVDQWRYYSQGLEIYRDIDSDFNKKVDQSRWLNTGGSRWGLDTNEDGRIDAWKVLSAEEATQLAVRSLVVGDHQMLQVLLINQSDVRKLGIDATYSQKLLAAVSNSADKLRTVIARSRIITPKTKWMRFDSLMPNVIPADNGKATSDLTVYENVMAIVETSGEQGLIQIGEMVRVGVVWKLTQIPRPLKGNSIVVESGLLMQPIIAKPTLPINAGIVSPEAQRLLEQLQTLDRNSPGPTTSRVDLARYTSQRSELLKKLITISKTDEERYQWTRQMVDGLVSAVQSGGYLEGLERLKSIEVQVRRASPRSPLVAYVSYRRLLAEYNLEIQTADVGKHQKVQQQWLQGLEEFVKSFPAGEDIPDALFQLATNEEFRSNNRTARHWYGQLTSRHSDTSAGLQAIGALRRLDLKGQLITLSGPGLNGEMIDIHRLRGRVVLVCFWATWCKPCTEDIPQLRALYEQYYDRGFEIIGVNLDATIDPIRPYLSRHRVRWPQIYQPGGLASPLAQTFGIISLPTMFLTAPDGKVISHNTSVVDLKTRLPEQLKK